MLTSRERPPASIPVEQVRLVNEAGDGINEHFIQLSRDRPEVILHTLERVWQTEGSVFRDSPILQDKLRQLPVPCQSGTTRPLWEVYMPFLQLRQKYEGFMKPGEAFPFLDLGNEVSDEELNGKWSFLWKELGVAKNDDVSFLLDILSCIREANPNGLPMSRGHELAGLYCEMEAKFSESEEPASMRDSCRASFEDTGIIAVLDFVGSDSQWALPSQCLWDAPSFITTKFSLRCIYEKLFLCDKEKLDILSEFFRRTLCVPELSWEDLVVELISLRESGCRDLGRLMKIYKHLDTIRSSSIEDKLRQTFEDEPLIFLTVNGKPTWVRLSQCIWSSPIEVLERVSIEEHYSSFKTLFVDVLGIEQLNARIVYHKLLGMGLKHPPIAELRETLLVFNSLILESKDLPDPQPFIRRKLFPIQNADGSEAIVSAETDFVVVDRQHLSAPFAGRLRVLSFNLQESLKLRPFLRWAGLKGRRLSACVTESTFISGTESRPILSPVRDIKTKADALIRIAASFNSPVHKRDRERLYKLVQATQTLEADTISAIQNVIQDGKVISSRVMKSDVHFSDETDSLTVYVPSDGDSQDISFAAVLPGKLAAWLMGDPSVKVNIAMKSVVGAALQYDGAVLESILERQGIGQDGAAS